METQEPIRRLKIGNCDIIILGTAHVSMNSVNAVKEIISTEKPDTVCVELCSSRMKSIMDPDHWKNLDIFKVFKERKMYLLMSSLILSSFQKKLGGDIKPGLELKTAIEEGNSINAKVVPIDREVQTTLKRSWGTVGLFSKMNLLSALIASLFVKEDVKPEKIEELKTEDMLKDLFSQLPPRYNRIKKVIIDERDIYLAENIRRNAEGSNKLFAVVGAGHLNGIMENIHKQNDIEPLDIIPKTTLLQKIQYLIFPGLIIGSMFLLYFTQTKQDVMDVLYAWILFKSGLAALGAALCFAHPISILLAAIIAPIGNFNPIIKPGWVAALTESYLHKPLVQDFENLAQDSEHFLSFWKNRVVRIFMVLLLPQIGSSIGTFLALGKLWSKLKLF